MSELPDTIVKLKKALQATTPRVIAVIGPEALTVEHRQPDGHVREVSFYRLVAERLLQDRKLPVDLLDAPGPMWMLHRAALLLMEHRSCSIDVLRDWVDDAIQELQSQCGLDADSGIRPSGALLELAQLNGFRLILSLTPDDVLPNTIRAVQPELTLDVAGYMQKLDQASGYPIDVQEPAENHLRYYQLLGRIGNIGEFAIHEEDALEHLQLFREEAERSAKTLLGDLRSGTSLFVYLGCGLPDWMGRGLLRMLGKARFTSVERPYDFFCVSSQDDELNRFLDQFSKKSVVLPWTPLEFARQIRAMRQATARNSSWQPAKLSAASPESAHIRPQRANAPSIFVSYATENAKAALRIVEQLQKIGFGEVWLDRKTLIAGDDWTDKIDDAIATCEFFMPLLSREADHRDDGVYWKEWRKALDCAQNKFGAFMLPVGIDLEHPFKAGYQRIFTDWTRPLYHRHLLHAPGGEMSLDTRDQLARRIRQPLGNQP